MTEDAGSGHEEDSFVPLDHRSFIGAVSNLLPVGTPIVLIADDEPEIRQLVVQDIKRMDPGVLTVEAGNGREALDKLADIRSGFGCDPILIVLDLKMPELDGWDVIEELKNEYEALGREQGIPLIVLSQTSGHKGVLPFRRSVHAVKRHYTPMITVAKEQCAKPGRYDGVGEKGLVAWVRHFLERA